MGKTDFFVPKSKDGKDQIYLCGHSLGLMPKLTQGILANELQKWAESGVEGHFSGEMPWVDFHSFATPHLAKLTGAENHEVVAMGSLTNNIHLLLASFFKPNGERKKIIIEPNCFGSDVYALKSHLKWHGLDADECLVEVKSDLPNQMVSEVAVQKCFQENKDQIALLFFPGVQYLTGQVFDIGALTDIAHRHGAMAGFDLAHAMGNVPLKLHDNNADFAVWCSYKYLNSGPGGVGGLFVHEKHGLNNSIKRLSGWWGSEKNNRFLMLPEFEPMPGAEGWQLSNAPVLSLCAHIAALQVFEKHGYVENWFSQTLQLHQTLRNGLEQFENKGIIEIITPKNNHGAMLSFKLKEHMAKDVESQLKNLGVVCDARHPDIIRVSAIPLFNDESDVSEFLRCFEMVIT